MRAVVGLVGSTEVVVKVAVGNFAVSKKSGVCRWAFSWSSLGATSVSGMVAVRREAEGLAGSSVSSACTFTNWPT